MSSSKFDYPSINVGGKSNEQNMQAVKAYLNNLSDQLNFYVNTLEEEIAELREMIESMQ